MKSQKLKLDQAVKVLQQGGVIAYPTEAVYGLGCDPENLTAVKNILELKKREKEKGLILVAANFEQLKPYLTPLEKHIEDKIISSWKNSTSPITWLVPAKSEVSDYLKGKFDSLAIRVSHHPLVKELCEMFDSAIVSTSANISKQEAARTSEQVKEIFNEKIDLVLEGKNKYSCATE